MAKKMTKIRTAKKGVTVIEVVIAATLSCIILGVGMAMMKRSNTQFKKSNDLISIQRLMDNILERIRSDVRSLKRVKIDDDSSNKNKISFVVIKYSSENDANDDLDSLKNDYALITYEFNPEEKTLYRTEVLGCGENGDDIDNNKDIKSDFHGARQVYSMNFEPIFFGDDEDSENKESKSNGDDFKCLNVAMQIASNEYSGKESDASTLSIACQFYSTCVESELRISKLRELK